MYKRQISNVAKDDFIVRSITKPGVEVHGYKPTPSDLVNASNAFVFIDNGLSLIHISEPTRRVVISYAVLCLKKKFFFLV